MALERAAIGALRVGKRLQAHRRGAREGERHALAGRSVQAMLRRLAHEFRPVAVRQNEAGIGGENFQRNVTSGREEQAIAVQAVVAPFLVGAKILDRRLDLDDPDLSVTAERHQIGAAAGKKRQLGDARKAQRQQQALRPARDGERGRRLAAVQWNRGWGNERHGTRIPRRVPTDKIGRAHHAAPLSRVRRYGIGVPIMIAVSLNPDVERRLSELAKLTGRSESDFARELIEGNIEDLEDRYLAENAIKEGGPRFTSEQVRKELGLDH